MSRRSPATSARGQATVEVALALPVVVIVLLLVIQVSLIARTQILVVHAAREGARAAAVDPTLGAARRAAAATPGLDPSRLVVSMSSADASTVRVTVRYRTPTDVALIGVMLSEPELRATVVMRREDVDTPP